MDFDEYLKRIKEESEVNIQKLHHLAKKLWQVKKVTPFELQNKCSECWDKLKNKIGSKIVPLIKVSEDHPVTDLIFGSGSFSTGDYQAAQFKKVKSYIDQSPVILQGIVTNKSEENGCNGKKVALKYDIPYISLDFADWYHEVINENEPNPTRITRYWYQSNDPNRPSSKEIAHRFNIRQDQFHKDLGKEIKNKVDYPTDIVSARGYNFQFCHNLFLHQKAHSPHINDTHPADLTYIDPATKNRLYPGWQSGAVQLMLEDNIKHIRGCLIEVEYMDEIEQIDKLDEGSVLAVGQGVKLQPELGLNASNIQEAIKIMDDYFFCTLEPTGIILTWGISEKKVPVTYQNLSGEPVQIKQHAILVGNKILSGIEAFGSNFSKNLNDLEDFLLS